MSIYLVLCPELEVGSPSVVPSGLILGSSSSLDESMSSSSWLVHDDKAAEWFNSVVSPSGGNVMPASWLILVVTSWENPPPSGNVKKIGSNTQDAESLANS